MPELITLNIPLFLVHEAQALYVNPGCPKCISGIKVSPVNKNVFVISFILYF